MKALILAAGFGTRLLPFTQMLPKPLFTLNDIPLLLHTIVLLEASGCDHILINTHHLPDKINEVIKAHQFTAKIQLLHEPEILDTGGAIANAMPYLDQNPFFVVNADVISSIDLKSVYNFHLKHQKMATLILHDYKKFNKVQVNANNEVIDFKGGSDSLAFTGLQVLSPQLSESFPKTDKFSSIELYQQLCEKKQVMAWIEKDLFWSDIGTPESYSGTSMQTLAAKVFNIKQSQIFEIDIQPLAGDGSDRKWYRAMLKGKTCIISDHGICLPDTDKHQELMAFVHIGNHLKKAGLNVPMIQALDTISGMVILDDLGNTHLQAIVHKSSQKQTLNLYKTVIQNLIEFSAQGYADFDTDWTCQTPSYSKSLIIEKECLYFMSAFIEGYLNKQINHSIVMDEFKFIANHALEYAMMGLMHRDFQSRNIMMNNGRPFFIDFQSARIGPLQYDLASLLIDPYVNLNKDIKTQLLDYTMQQLELKGVLKQQFVKCYTFCCLTRNLQMLGAFGFLTTIKKKTWFEQFIPVAVQSLKKTIEELNTDKIPQLSNLVDRI